MALLDCPKATAWLPDATAPAATAVELSPVASGGGKSLELLPVKMLEINDRTCVRFVPSVPLMPAATLVMRRSLPGAPIETVLAAFATEPAPSATELVLLATARSPRATLERPLAVLLTP